MMARERYDDGTDSIKLGKEACEACRVPAGEIEGVVVRQLRGVLRSPQILSLAVMAWKQQEKTLFAQSRT